MTKTDQKVYREEFDSLYFYRGITWNWKMNDFHQHSQYEILLFLSDGVNLEIEDRVFEGKRGDCFCINSEAYHRSSCKGAYERFVLMFDGSFITPYQELMGYDPTSIFTHDSFGMRLPLEEKNLEQISQYFGLIEKFIAKDMDLVYQQTHVKLLILEMVNALHGIAHSLLRNGNPEEYSISPNRVGMDAEDSTDLLYREKVEQIKTYIIKNIEHNLTLTEIAEEFQMNESYLSHYFKKRMGFTLTEYISTQKIQMAKRLLNEQMSVTDVAMQLSYSSTSHFIKNFKKITGITPKKYAQQESKESIHPGLQG